MSSADPLLSLLRDFQYLTIAAEALLIHDYFLTFSLEVDHIWYSRWSAVKIIFLLSRYGSLVGQSAYTLQILGVLSHGSSKFCSRFEGFILFYGLFQAEAIRMLVLLRAWAIWGCKRSIAIVLILAYAVYVSVVTGMLIYAMVFRGGRNIPFKYLAETGVCIIQSDNPQIDKSWIMPSIPIILDSIVFSMVALSLRQLFKETQCLLHPQSLLRALAVDAVLYLVVSCATSTIGILSQTILINGMFPYLSLVCNPLVIVTGQRVVLHLRNLQSLSYSRQVFDLNLVTDSSLFSRSAEDSRHGDPLAQQYLDRRDQGAASGIEMLDRSGNIP